MGWRKTVGRAKQVAVRRVAHLLYERRLGTRTSDWIMHEDYADHLDGEGKVMGERIGHEASDWMTLPRILRREDVTPGDVFLDLGCGEGRMVIEAATSYPLERVIGVELSSELAEVARRNVERVKPRFQARSAEIVRSDVLDFDVPPDVTIVYMYNPFRGAIFEAAVQRLIAAVDEHPRPLRVIYRFPTEEDALLATGRFRRVRIGRSLFGRRESNPYLSMYELMPAASSVHA